MNYSKTWSHTYVGAGVPIVDCQQEYRQVAMLGEDALTAEAQMGVNPTLSEEESTERASVSAEKIPVISITDGVVSSSPDLIHGGAASCIYVANSVALEDILSHRKPKGQGGSLLPIEEADQIQDSELEKPANTLSRYPNTKSGVRHFSEKPRPVEFCRRNAVSFGASPIQIYQESGQRQHLIVIPSSLFWIDSIGI